MKAQTIQVEKEQTVREMLQSLDLNEKMYFVSVDGAMGTLDQKLKSSNEVKIIPVIKGG